jgi:hypothetical protein
MDAAASYGGFVPYLATAVEIVTGRRQNFNVTNPRSVL